MRHQKTGRKFGRKSASRHALFSNMVSSLIEHERIETTDAKAKELRRIAEKTITWATSVGGIVGSDKADAADKARVVHAMRMAQRVVKHRPSLEKLFSELGPRFMGRAGGYTRIMKVRTRHGDAAPMSIIELVERSGEKAEKVETKGGEGKAAKADKPKAAPKKKAEAKAEGEQPAKKKAAPKAKKEEAASDKPKGQEKKKTKKDE